MTLGEKIKMLRSKSGLTQKDLADNLHVTFQTISKWENNENEPDVTALRELAKLFNCSMDYLLSPDEQEPQKEEPVNAAVTAGVTYVCAHCGKEIPAGEEINISNVTTLRHGGRHHSTTHKTTICHYHKECYEEVKKLQEENREREAKIRAESDKKVLEKRKRHCFGWGIAGGIVALVISLIVLLNGKYIGTFPSILIGIVIGYAIFAMLYCIISGSYIGEVFVWAAGLSIKFPGIIFSFSIEGFAFLIVLKVLFAILGFVIGVLALLLAIVLSGALGAVSFPFILIHNIKNNYDDSLVF